MREVAELLGVSNDVIRNWERNGLMTIRRNPYNNYRLFTKKDVERMHIIRSVEYGGVQPYGDPAHVHRDGWGENHWSQTGTGYAASWMRIFSRRRITG